MPTYRLAMLGLACYKSGFTHAGFKPSKCLLAWVFKAVGNMLHGPE